MKLKDDLPRNQTALSANLSAMLVEGSSDAQSALMLYTPVKENNVRVNLNVKQTALAIMAKYDSLSFFNIVLGFMGMGAYVGGKVDNAIQAAILAIPSLQADTYHVGKIAVQATDIVAAGVGVGVAGVQADTYHVGKIAVI